VGAAITRHAMTTVANWRSYGSVVWDGVTYGQRAHSFRSFFDLPLATHVALEPALAIDPGEKGDLAALARGGWTWIDPAEVSGTPAAYREFVRSSRGELSIAKSGYVTSRCGWFSDRSACYLAAGRPVITQETGFSKFLPTGKGLFGFRTMDDILAAVNAIECDYPGNCRAAREIAAEYFGAEKVVGSLMERVGL
jgi:hypothetical protein